MMGKGRLVRQPSISGPDDCGNPQKVGRLVGDLRAVLQRVVAPAHLRHALPSRPTSSLHWKKAGIVTQTRTNLGLYDHLLPFAPYQVYLLLPTKEVRHLLFVAHRWTKNSYCARCVHGEHNVIHYPSRRGNGKTRPLFRCSTPWPIAKFSGPSYNYDYPFYRRLSRKSCLLPCPS